MVKDGWFSANDSYLGKVDVHIGKVVSLNNFQT